MFKATKCFGLNIKVGCKVFLRYSLKEIGNCAEKSYETFLGGIQDAFEIPVFFLKEKVCYNKTAETLPFLV